MGNCCDTRVLPQECTNTPFSTDDRPRTKSSLTYLQS
ncbi:mCG113877, isoform CRA_b [Mus musculus]|nr:mCG113877, isoform CRA_b [Mus musculus]